MQRTTHVMPVPGSPGAPDIVTHLLRDHGLGFYSGGSVRSSTDSGQYSLTAMHDDHRAQHWLEEADHTHHWTW